MTHQEAYEELVRRAEPLTQFKRQRLSLVNGCSPIFNMGAIADELIAPLRSYIQAHDVKALFPSKSFSFLDMSEIWVGGDLNPSYVNPEVRSIMQPVLPTLKKLVRAATGLDLIMMRAVVKTLDSTALILPHCDDFTSHQVSLRTHVPIMMTPDCIGINWHPETLEPSYWRTPVGGFYAFNNFEPHTLVMLSPDSVCCDLVVDFMPAGLYRSNDASHFTALKKATEGHAPGFSEAINQHGITHTESSLTIRNGLLSRAGFDAQHLSFHDHLKPEVVENLRQVVIASARRGAEELDRSSPFHRTPTA